MTQLMLFGFADPTGQPLPLEVAQEYGFPLQYHTLDNDTLVYSVQDWLAGVAQTDNSRRFWTDLKKRMSKIELYVSCVQLPYKSSNGRTYQMDFADDKTLYTITQHMGVDTGIRNKVLEFLAKAGALADLIRQDPEAAQIELEQHHRRQLRAQQSLEWVQNRTKGKEHRKGFTAALLNANPETNIGQQTNNVYQGVLGMTAKQLRETLGIGVKKNPRDHLSALSLLYIGVAEEVCRIQLAAYGDDQPLPLPVIDRVVRTVAAATGRQAEEMALHAGIDLITGNPLLAAQN